MGVVGYTLGGGLSRLARRYGLAAERLLAVELVTADGRLVRADRRQESDLFWALRGGGGSFGAVTAIEFELVPLQEVYAGVMLWPVERASEVMHAWREWTAGAPDTVTTSARIMHFPPMPELPDFLRGRSVVVIDGASLGDEATAAGALARPGTGALGGIDGQYLMFAVGIPFDPSIVPALDAALALAASEFAPYGSGELYLNFAERAANPAEFFGEEAYARLRQVKADVDPSDRFRGNHQIAPAS